MTNNSTHRRSFLTLLGGAAAALPAAARAQQRQMPIVAYLSGLPHDAEPYSVAAFIKGLDETGYVDGQNVAIEFHWAESQYDRLPSMAAELVRRRVAVIAATGGSPAALAAKKATVTIPIVFQVGGDPVKFGLVASLNRPGGNMTGTTNINPEIVTKRFQLLCELVPAAAVVGWIFGPANEATSIVARTEEAEGAGRTLGRQVLSVTTTSEVEIDRAFDMFVRQGVRAVLVSANPLMNARAHQIVTLAARNRIATSHEFAEAVVAGGLTSYGSSVTDQYRQVGVYVGRILKGEKPADLPVLQPTKFEFVINLKTAKTLGLEISPQLLALTDEVIE